MAMSRSVRLRVALMVATIVLLTAVAWTQHRRAANAPPQTLLPLAPAAITQVEVQTREGVLRRFRREDGQWHMLAPEQGPANQAHLERLAELAAAKPLRWRPASDFDPARIGLEPAWATVRLNGTELRFGTLAALAPQRYVQVGEHIALISARYAADITATPDSELAHAGSTLPTL